MMFLSPKLTFVLHAVLIKIPAGIFVEIEKLIVSFTCKCKERRLSKTVLKNYDKVGRLHYLISRLF